MQDRTIQLLSNQRGRQRSFCASIAEGGGPQRVIISRADSAESLVIVEVSGIIGAIKAEVEAPDSFVADAVPRRSRKRSSNARSKRERCDDQSVSVVC